MNQSIMSLCSTLEMLDQINRQTFNPLLLTNNWIVPEGPLEHANPILDINLPVSNNSSSIGQCPYLKRRPSHNLIVPIDHIGKDGFQVNLDVSQFKSNELRVKVVDNYIVIEGSHGAREDQYGSIERDFTRRYLIPEGYDSDQIKSSLNSDGLLTISIPKPKYREGTNERIVPIQQTGPACICIRENPQEGAGERCNPGECGDSI